MKIKRLNKILLFALIATMLFAVVGLSGCSPKRHRYSDPAISTELEIQIRQDFVANGFARSIESVVVAKYFGTFNDASIVIIGTGAASLAQWLEKVAGIEFSAPVYVPIRAWFFGNFYTLTESHSKNRLTFEDLLAIRDMNDTFWQG